MKWHGVEGTTILIEIEELRWSFMELTPLVGVIRDPKFKPHRDRMIAAQALVHRASLVTMNADDYADVPGLSLLAW